MKFYKMMIFVGLFMFVVYFIFPQNVSPEKKVFVYKTVKGHDIKASVYLPKTKEKHPVVVYFHGGGFVFGNRDKGLNVSLMEGLIKRNYAVVSADYRLAPETKLEGIIQDVSDIVKWLKLHGPEKFNIDNKKIAAAGGSAGGYLALSTGFNKKFSPDAIIAISTPTGFSNSNIQMGDLSILNQPGPYDIVKDSYVSYGDYDKRMILWRFMAKNRLILYEIFGFDPSQNPEKLKEYKINNNIYPEYPPVLIIHSKNDTLVDLKQVNKFYKFLKDKDIKAELFLVNDGHGSELINKNPDVIDKIVGFLNIQLN